MLAIRIKFKKEGRAKYISHLDLNRCMQRALRRAQIPVWRTQGFNPHPYIVFAMPLSLFYESDCEIMDARLDGKMQLDEIKQRLSAQMPEGIVIVDVSIPTMKLADVGFAEYALTLDFEDKKREELEEKIAEVLSNDEMLVEKETKHKTVNINVKPYFESAEIKISDGCINIRTVLPSGSQLNINPSLLVLAIKNSGIAPDLEHIRRLQIFNHDMRLFL